MQIVGSRFEIFMFDAIRLVAWLHHHDHDYPGISIESPPKVFILSTRIAGHAFMLFFRRITIEIVCLRDKEKEKSAVADPRQALVVQKSRTKCVQKGLVSSLVLSRRCRHL